MLIDTRRNRLQLQRQASFLQQVDASQAAVVRTRDHRERFVCLSRAAVERDLDREWRPLREVIRNPLVDDRTVGEQRDQKSFFLGVGVDLEEVFARKNFTSGVEEPDSTHLYQFVEHAKVLFFGHLAPPGIEIVHG